MEVSLYEFKSTPVFGSEPVRMRAIYIIDNKDGHLVYRLKHGSIEVVDATEISETGPSSNMLEFKRVNLPRVA